MKNIFHILLLILPLQAHEISVKQRIAANEQRLEQPGFNLAELHFQLARDYFEDQELDRAFDHFLTALKELEPQEPPPLSAEETAQYEAALALYLQGSGNDPVAIAQELIEKYGDANPNWLHLHFVLATAYANLEQFDAFFERFYRGYPFLGESFLAYKTRGILALRLAKRTLDPAYQQEAVHLLSQALDRNEKDSGLYKVLIFLAKDEKNDALVLSYLEKMVQKRAPIPRGDIYLYVREAVALEAPALAQEIIDLAREQYTFSRAITAAQEYLNQWR